MLKYLLLLFVVFSFFKVLTITHQKKLAGYESLLNATGLSAGNTVEHEDQIDVFIYQLPVSHWREKSWSPFKHTWWTGEQVLKNASEVERCLLKDLEEGTFFDAKGNPIEDTQDLESCINRELMLLGDESVSESYIHLVLTYIHKLLQPPHVKNVKKEQEKNRLIARLKAIKSILPNSTVVN